jgi:4-hydroxy-tetrahydrodipicolinate reductase
MVVIGREGMVGARGREIGVHAVRIGDVVGEHTVIFAGNKERIELTHRAHSREAFSEGSLLAIRWVAGRKDGRVHSMAEVLGL